MVKKLFDVLGPRYKERVGGYTRVIKAGFRHGDNAAVAVIEFVDRDVAAKGLNSGPVQEKSRGETARRQRSEGPRASRPLFPSPHRQETKKPGNFARFFSSNAGEGGRDARDPGLITSRSARWLPGVTSKAKWKAGRSSPG